MDVSASSTRRDRIDSCAPDRLAATTARSASSRGPRGQRPLRVHIVDQQYKLATRVRRRIRAVVPIDVDTRPDADVLEAEPAIVASKDHAADRYLNASGT